MGRGGWEGKKVIGGRREGQRWFEGGGREKGDWREEGRRKVIEGRREGQRWLKGGGRTKVIGGRKEGEGCLEGGRKEKDDRREEGRRRMIGERKNEEGWLEGERKAGKKEETKEWSKKRDPNLVLQGFLLYGTWLSNVLKFDSLPDMLGRKNIHLLTTYLCFFASVHFPLFFFRSEPIDK